MPKQSLLNLFKSYSNYFLVSLALFTCVISFQNCAPQLQEGEETSSSTLEAPGDQTPFAYSFDIDHIALMTCPHNNDSRNNGGFTMKWGAYKNGFTANNAGLRFSQGWLDQKGNNSPQGLMTLLQQSQKNQGINIVSGYFRPYTLTLSLIHI